MPQGEQVKNGKAFEFAIAQQYAAFINAKGFAARLVEDKAYKIAKRYFELFDANEQTRFQNAAYQTIDTLIKIEPGLLAQKNAEDVLQIKLMKDAAGEDGDVRDVVFSRTNPAWEIGFSAKNNNDAVKHSRLSHVLDFGQEWLQVPCHESYWEDIKPVFDIIGNLQDEGIITTWEEMGKDKQLKIYIPLLEAFRKELMLIDEQNESIPQKLIKYLIGEYPFYKIIKDDTHNLVIVKAFNINGELNKSVNKVRSKYKVPSINLPNRIVEFKMKEGSQDTLNMILDGGWEVSFRIHNAATKLEKSLKFDIRLSGNPPVLFTQHLFQD